MNTKRFFDRLADALLAHAGRRMPAHRRDWAMAMRAELEHAAQSRVRWAFGCVIASYAARWQSMNRSSLLISKWLLGIECLVVFAPLTLLWLIAVAKLNHFIGEPKTLFDIAFITVAPFGLVQSLRFVIFGKAPHYKTQIALTLAFALLGVLMIIRGLISRGPAFLWGDVEWNLIILASLLPALCSWHLSLFAKRSAEPLRPA